MHPLGEKQLRILKDYENFIRGQNSKRMHSLLRILGAMVVLIGCVLASPFWLAIGVGLIAVSFLGNQQVKRVTLALEAAKRPHTVKTLSLSIDTELWENNTNYYAIVETPSVGRHKIYFIPLDKAPRKGEHLGTGFYLNAIAHPVLMCVEDSLIIPSQAPKII